jgi:hypothetical protein
MNNCPKNPNHECREIPIENETFIFCETCREDVVEIARQMANPVAQAEPRNMTDEVADSFDGDDGEGEDEDDDEDLDDDQDVYPGFGAQPMAPPQITPEMRPGLDLGAGTHQLVMHNSPDIEASYVTEVLVGLLKKSYHTCQYLMMDAHYRGQTVVIFGSEQELTEKLGKIEELKNVISQRGTMFCDTVRGLQFTVDPRANNAM